MPPVNASVAEVSRSAPDPVRPTRTAYGRKRILVAIVLASSLVAGVAGIVGVACAPRRAVGQAGAGVLRPDTVALALGDAVSRGADLTYTATYGTASGATVSVTQEVPRRAYRGASVTYLLDPDVAYLCRSAACERAAGADALPPAHARAISTAFGGDFVTPEGAVAVLDGLLDQPAVRALKARRAVGNGMVDCVVVSVDAVHNRTVCFSPTGVLVYYDGLTEAGAPVRIELRTYATTAAESSFAPPARAKITEVTEFR